MDPKTGTVKGSLVPASGGAPRYSRDIPSTLDPMGVVGWMADGGSFAALDDRSGIRNLWTFPLDRKSTRLNSSHGYISYAVFCLKKKNTYHTALKQSEP